MVRKHCFRVGLYWQGLTHDLSKYSPTEFRSGILYYQGTRSPNSRERELKGHSLAWMHHKGRNKHHFEYWT
ncbi:MAG: catalase, partial [Oscillospiraceae bacterium]|nr:catalase [Oscillospiraceae bacterium]